MSTRFGTHAKAIRMNAEISLRKVAEQLNFTPAYISDIERGNRQAPAPEIARKWAVLIGADPDEFDQLARLDRRKVELNVTTEHFDSSQAQAAVFLQRRWDEMSEPEYAELLRFLRKEQAGDGN